MADKENGEKNLTCKFCGKVFAQRQSKSRHEKFKCAENPKKDITQFRCDSCGKEFGRRDVLLKHKN